MLDEIKLTLSHSDEDKSRTIVRLSTSYWYDNNGVHLKKSLNILKRKSFGYNCLLEQCRDIGASEIENIENFLEYPDGIYEVVVCNISRDWETGIIDDWELKLVPFKDDKEVSVDQ